MQLTFWDVWETSAEILYWLSVTNKIWVVLLIARSKFSNWHDQSEALSRSGWFQRSFLRRHFAGEPVVASWNIGCLLRLFLRVNIQDLAYTFQPFYPQYLHTIFPYTYLKKKSWQNLIEDQSILTLLTILQNLMTFFLDDAPILLGENRCWILLGFKGLTTWIACPMNKTR